MPPRFEQEQLLEIMAAKGAQYMLDDKKMALEYGDVGECPGLRNCEQLIVFYFNGCVFSVCSTPNLSLCSQCSFKLASARLPPRYVFIVSVVPWVARNTFHSLTRHYPVSLFCRHHPSKGPSCRGTGSHDANAAASAGNPKTTSLAGFYESK